MSGYEVGNRVKWRSDTLAGKAFGCPVFTVIETGLESLVDTMPGEQVRVRQPDGSETRVWVEDIERAPDEVPATGPEAVPARDFRTGDTIRWKHAGLWGDGQHEVTRAGLSVTGRDAVAVRMADGREAAAFTDDIGLVPGAERGPLPAARRGKCRYCSRTFTLRDSGRVRSHNVKGTGRRCGGSGQVPS